MLKTLCRPTVSDHMRMYTKNRKKPPLLNMSYSMTFYEVEIIFLAVHTVRQTWPIQYAQIIDGNVHILTFPSHCFKYDLIHKQNMSVISIRIISKTKKGYNNSVFR